MSSIIFTAILFGSLGGLVRALLGLAKYFSKKNKHKAKFSFWYFIFTLFVATAVGALAGAVVDGDWRLSLIAGYAGTDFMESLYKIGYM